MSDSTDILSLVTAWLLGLLTPSIVRSIEKQYRAKEIGAGILSELRHLRHTCVLIAFRLHARAGTLDADFLKWFGSLLEKGEGGEEDKQWHSAYQQLVKLTPAQLNNSPLGKSLAGQSPRPVPYTLPYLESQLGNVYLFPQDLQRRLMAIRFYLSLFNNDVDFIRTMLALTFEPTVMQLNHAQIDTNIEMGYRNMGRRAETLARDIDETLDKYRAQFETTP